MPEPEWRWLASMYEDAVVTELTIDDKTGFPLGQDYNEDGSFREDSPEVPEGDESYAELAKHVYEALLSLDYSDSRNSAEQYKDWREFKGVGNTPPVRKSVLHDSKAMLDSAEFEYLLSNGSDNALFRIIHSQAEIYDDTFPGVSNTYHNRPLDSLLDRILHWGLRERKDLETALRWLRYRFEVTAMGNRYVEFLGLDRPCNQTCEEFNVYAFENSLKRMGPEGWDMKERYERYRDLSRWFWQEKHVAYKGVTAARFLFREPAAEDGKRFAKGGEYIVAALFWTAYKKEQCIDIVEGLMEHVHRGVMIAKELVQSHPEVLQKRRQVTDAWGVSLRDLKVETDWDKTEEEWQLVDPSPK